MNEIIQQVQWLTMTSLEIARLTGKEHSKVLRDIEKMFADLEMAQESQAIFGFAEQSQTGEMKRYKLPKDLTITLVSWYNAKLRKAIIDRWLELEKPKSPMELVLDSIKFLEIEVAKEKEKNLLLETKIEEDKPLVDFARTIWNSADAILVREFTKLINIEWIDIWEKRLFKWFRDNWYLNKNNEPYQTVKKYFTVIERPVVTIKGTLLIPTTKINWLWQVYFLEKLRKEFNIN